jgi:hypothetical protein
MTTNKEDALFIIKEVKRFTGLSIHDIQGLSREDLIPSLPHPSGDGVLLCGRAAAERIELLAKRYLAKHLLSSRISPNEVVERFGDEFSRRFIGECREVNNAEVEAALSAAVTSAAMKIADVTHFLPCHLTEDAYPDSISIGPVHFRTREAFFELIQRELDRSVEPCGDGSSAEDVAPKEIGNDLTRLLRDQAVNYYKGFKWVAEVQVRGCDQEVSLKRAELAVFSAVNVLHLLLGAFYSDSMRVGGPRLEPDLRGRISRGGDGAVEIIVSRAPVGQPLDSRWWEFISAGDGRHYLGCAGITLEVTTDPDLMRPLCYRFLDALSWFGQAVRETSDAARFVKFITAIERIVVTNEDDRTETVKRRGAALCWEPNSERKVYQLSERIGELYALRSKLVHGDISPFDERIGVELYECETVARRVLLRGLSFFQTIGLTVDNISQKRLRRHYKNYLQHIHKLDKS